MESRILVIDDEETIRFAFRTFLIGEGYHVVTAENLKKALAAINGCSFDVIFADIILPGKTGVDFLRIIREKDLKIPVIMITGAPNIKNAAECLRLGAFDYLVKPVRKETLLKTAQIALQHKKLADEREQDRINLEAVFRSVKDGIISVNSRFEVTACNDSVVKSICEFGEGSVCGRPFGSVKKSCSGKCIKALTETLRTRRFVEINNVRCEKKNRSDQIVTLTSSPLLNSRGAFTGAVMVIKDESRIVSLEADLKERRRFYNIIGKSRQMQQIYSLIEALANVQTTVLITGESGTGKELVAEALHNSGKRKSNHMVKVNCSALSENLLESELFGHVKGAFTGAVGDKIGRFQKADGGTLFLDEIGDISPMVQLRLLRVLQSLEFERVGDSTPTKVDVRIIAATNQDLATKVQRGEFRHDLFYRLKVMELELPPLRKRPEDIPFLTEYFLQKYNEKFNKKIRSVSSDVQTIFTHYFWPGNIRELEHALEHAFILCDDASITPAHLPSYLKESQKTGSRCPRDGANHDRESIIRALDKTGWNKSRAAELLGISRKTLYRKLEKHAIATRQAYV